MKIVDTYKGSVTVMLKPKDIEALTDSVCREVATAEAISIVNILGVESAKSKQAHKEGIKDG